MASDKIIPKKDLLLITNAEVGDQVGTRFGFATVTPLMKQRAAYALKHPGQKGRRS